MTDGAVRYKTDGFVDLRFWSEMFTAAQEERMRAENRIFQYAKIGDMGLIAAWFDPSVKKGVTSWQAADLRAREHKLRLQVRRLCRVVAPPGVIAWRKASPGVGEDLLARLLGRLGHPRVAEPQHWEGSGAGRHLVAGEPYERSAAELRQYCGHGRPGRVVSGASWEECAMLGSPVLKKLVWLLSSSAVVEPGRRIVDVLDFAQTSMAVPPSMLRAASEQSFPHPNLKTRTREITGEESFAQRSTAGASTIMLTAAERTSRPRPNTPTSASPGPGGDESFDTATTPNMVPDSSEGAASWPYRIVYEDRRIATVGRLHSDVCVRCGPSGRPALPGSPWNPGHAQADALRVVGQRILTDLWLAAGDDG